MWIPTRFLHCGGLSSIPQSKTRNPKFLCPLPNRPVNQKPLFPFFRRSNFDGKIRGILLQKSSQPKLREGRIERAKLFKGKIPFRHHNFAHHHIAADRTTRCPAGQRSAFNRKGVKKSSQ